MTPEQQLTNLARAVKLHNEFLAMLAYYEHDSAGFDSDLAKYADKVQTFLEELKGSPWSYWDYESEAEDDA